MGASFALVLLLFIAALGVCLASFARIDKAERRLETFENQRRAIDHAAILMREQYIHQAHTLIAFDASHVEHYREFARDASDAIVELRQSSTASEDADLIDELEHCLDGERGGDGYRWVRPARQLPQAARHKRGRRESVHRMCR